MVLKKRTWASLQPSPPHPWPQSSSSLPQQNAIQPLEEWEYHAPGCRVPLLSSSFLPVYVSRKTSSSFSFSLSPRAHGRAQRGSGKLRFLLTPQTCVSFPRMISACTWLIIPLISTVPISFKMLTLAARGKEMVPLLFPCWTQSCSL